MPKVKLPSLLNRKRAAKLDAPRPSRHVRKLSHRQPLPKRKGDLLILVTQKAKLFPLVFACIAAFAFIVGTFHHYLMNSDYFSVSKIEITGTHRLTQDQILRTINARAGLKRGDSIFLTSESAMQRALESVPEVDTASVRKEWPSSISVIIEEKQAMGILATTTGSYVYDGRGSVFANAKASDFRGIERPLITAMPTANVQPGYRIPPVDLARADQYIDVFTKASPALAKSISEFHFEPETGMTVVLAGGERFECGARPPQETGPAIESLLVPSASDAGPVLTASLLSNSYAIIRRADSAITEKQIAKND
ncbi:MAG: FtsQ-type POTRA domain-containing protein [Candidatus Sumerlaeota bacterium]